MVPRDRPFAFIVISGLTVGVEVLLRFNRVAEGTGGSGLFALTPLGAGGRGSAFLGFIFISGGAIREGPALSLVA